MKKVITYGTFDVLHIGHINLLRRAKEFGDKLYVGISSDQFNTIKHKQSILDFENRKAVVESIRYVDYVFKEENWEQKQNDIEKYGIDVFIMGNDWYGQFDYLKSQCEVIYLSRTPDISTTFLKGRAKKI